MAEPADATAVYEKLKSIRSRLDLTIRPTPLLREKYVDRDGTLKDLKLRYYQIQGILHLLAMRRFLLGDDTGLGKTIQTIGSLCYLWEKVPTQKVIVLTTKSATGQWEVEFDRFTTGVKVFLCQGSPTQRTKIRQQYLDAAGPTVLIMGYRTAVQDFSHLQNWKDYILVADEATAFKNPTTQVGQVCRHLSNQSQRRWALTATLIKNSLIEGWGIYQVIAPELFGSRNAFLNQYCIVEMMRIPKSNRRIPMIVGYRDSDIKRFREKIDPFFLGRPKHEVASELPPLITRTIECELTQEQEEKYAEALSGILEVERNNERLDVEVTKLTAVTYCQQIVNHPALIGASGESDKLDTLIDLLTEEFEGEKVIVFSRFKKMIDLIIPALTKAKIKSVRITGDEDQNQRKASQTAFQDPRSDTTVICITTAGSEAINLQAAKAIVFYDTPFSAGEYLQLLGRMIRIGSEHDRCYAIHLLAKKTIDDRVMKIMMKKLQLVEKVLGKRIKGETDTVTVAVENDLSDIFNALRDDARARGRA